MNRIAKYDLDGNKISEHIERETIARFIVRGRKMYIWKMEDMLDILTKEEFKTLLKIYDSKSISRANILKKPFRELTSDMSKVSRSRFKRKLIDNKIMVEYKNKFMLNPYIFVPENDKNIDNFQYLVQRSYKALVDDKDIYFDGIDEFIEYIFEE